MMRRRVRLRFIHLMGPHYPYTMDENEQRVGSLDP